MAIPAIEEGLQHIIEENPGCATFTPEQVYQGIRDGRADLYATYLDDQYGGFVILGTRFELFTGEPRLLIWCAYMQRKFPRAKELSRLVYRAIDEIARARGIRKEFFITSRPGWEREAPRRGFKKLETTWIREVD